MSSLLSKFLHPKQGSCLSATFLSLVVSVYLSFELGVLGRFEDSTMEEFEYESLESEGRVSWIWGKVVSFGKKVLIGGVLVSSAPILVPLLLVVSTIAFISSVPYCLFLANYACTQKLMSSLLPNTGEIDKDDSKLGHGAFDEAEPWIALHEPTLSEIKEDEEMAKESTSLIEEIRDEGRADRGISERDGGNSENARSDKVHDQPGKQQAPETGHEGELGSFTTESSTGKEQTSSNEPNDQGVSGARGTGDEKPKNTTKKKRKTGHAGVQ